MNRGLTLLSLFSLLIWQKDGEEVGWGEGWRESVCVCGWRGRGRGKAEKDKGGDKEIETER